MVTRLTVDRFEGDKKQIAVLLTDAGDPVDFPRALLPRGTKAGDVLAFSVEAEVVVMGRTTRKGNRKAGDSR